MEELAQSLQSDCTIDLVIGDPMSSTTFKMSRVQLEHTSEYFKAALKYQHFGTGKPDTLAFPEDDVQAWKVLLYWIVKHKLPKNEELLKGGIAEMDGKERYINPRSLCISCWALGDQYCIAAFQDQIMLELLLSVEGQPFTIAITDVVEAFEMTRPGSVLRELMVEELVAVTVDDNQPYFDEECKEALGGLLDVDGFAEVFDRMTSAYKPSGPFYMPRIPGREDGQGLSPFWKFLVGKERPGDHWLQIELARRVREEPENWVWPE
ncbi:hypothetical protein LTR10_000679 [Elasticomyces elasticus]|nr:hypothetical protein LTR10_000679 [Elasticomyces elasticus]KAK4980073.1 hypothetical protein LTR42_000380 [Elasticomyces elasticus]